MSYCIICGPDFDTACVYITSWCEYAFQTRLSKILAIKKDCIKDLKEMNTQAEKMVTTPELLSSDDVFGNMVGLADD